MRKRLKQIFSAALAGIVMCTAITFYPVETKAAAKAAANNIWEGVGSADWMANLDDSLKISEINLPGTHDSGTKNVTASSNAQCQDKSITEQLNIGVRFLDVRLEDEGEKLRLVHGTADCKSEDGSKLYLDEVFNDCYQFLDAHPTETIVMSMKKDDGNATDGQIETYIHKYIGDNKEKYWYLNNDSPTLNAVRGKIVLMRRYYHAKNEETNTYDEGHEFENGYGVRIFWGDQGGSDVVDTPWSGPDRVSRYGYLRYCVQDRYQYSDSNKWTAVQKGLDNPPHTSNERKQVEDGSYINITPQSTFFLNFMSSAGPAGFLDIPTTTPKKIADVVNANFLSYNNGSLEYGKNYGWIIMDFATEELAKHVYQSNKSLKLEVDSTIKALEGVIPTDVTADMKLPSNGEEAGGVAGTSITWSCNPASVLRTNGTQATLVCPASGDVTATLTATVASGSCTKQKEFTVQVKALDAVFAELGTVVNRAEALINDAANARYNLDSLKETVATAKGIIQAGADNVSSTQVNASTEALNTLMERGFALKSTTELRENLLGWYPLTASGKDVSGNHNNGTATGITFDKENGAKFSGGNARTSYVKLPEAMFNRTEENDNLTISFWVKDEQGTNSNAFGLGNGTQCNPSNGGSKHFIVNTNKSGKVYANACVSGWSEGANCIETAAPAKNTWFHLTIVMEGKKFTLYKDGVKVKDITEDYSLAEMGNVTFAYIGNAIYAHNGGGDKDFKGNIKDFRVYDCAVAPEQAAAIFNDKDIADTSAAGGQLIAHYPLTSDSKDISGNRNDGVATGVTFSSDNGAAFTDGGNKQSYISLPTAMFDGEEQLTVSFWVKDTKSDDTKNNTVFGFGSGTDKYGNNTADVFKYVLINTNNKDKKRNLKAVVTKNTYHDEKGFQETECSLPANEWAHITCVFDGTDFTLYKNGDLIGTKNTGIKLTDFGTNAAAYIGNSVWIDADPDYSGFVKDFRIYNCALGETEAKGLMDESIKEELMAGLETALNLDITKGEDGSLSMSITDGSLTLPTTACGGAATVSWESSNKDVIDNAGKVTLPAANEEIAEVTLTATVTMNGKTTEIIFKCSVFTKLNVNTADLQAVLSSAEITTAGLNEADYTVSSWSALQQALDTAKRQLRKPTSEADVAAAATDLQAKKNALVRLGDKTALNSFINTVKSLNQADYTTASWSVLQTALTQAETAAGSNDVSQADVDTAMNNLAAKKNALVKRGDKATLNADIEAAGKLDENDYTQQTWTAFQEVLDEVKQIASDAEATEQDVAAAEKLLKDAVNALKKITYTVTFDSDNGSDNITVTVEKGEKASAPQVPKKDGFAFVGWFAEGVQTEFDFINTPITGNITLTAKWVEGHTVTFHPDNDSEIWTVAVEDGEKVVMPETVPQKEGYVFEYWYAEGEEDAFDFENTEITADLTLIAKWKEKPNEGNGDDEKDDRVVTFHPDNGSDSWTVTVKDGEKVSAPEPVPEKAGYVFEYWYAEGEETGFDFENRSITADITLMAKWKKVQNENPGGNEDPGSGDNQKPISIASAQMRLSKTTFTYNGKAQKPKVTVTYKGKALKNGQDYDVSYGSNKKAGQGTVKVIGKGSYNGQKTLTFTIMPQTNKISKLTNKSKGKLVVKLSKSAKKTGAKGFEISYATKKNFKGAKKVKTTKNSYTLKKLKKGKTYYVRVRSYAKIGKKIKYSKYSKAVKKKVTK